MIVMRKSQRTFLSRTELTRKENIMKPKQRFLIVCEGTKTEKNYFEAFPVVSKQVVVIGLGQDPLSIVDKAIEEKDKDDDVDQVWCVFDRDSVPSNKFMGAIQKAESRGIRVAYSNEAFELWYLLHYNYYDCAISRQEYKKILESLMKRKYKKCDPSLYEELLEKQEQAIAHANRLLKSYGKRHSPDKDNPSTTVYRLVQELNKYLLK
jgi:hypothetical protein